MTIQERGNKMNGCSRRATANLWSRFATSSWKLREHVKEHHLIAVAIGWLISLARRTPQIGLDALEATA